MHVDEFADVALPRSWRTFEHLQAQVMSPSFVQRGSSTDAEVDGSLNSTAIFVLYFFFRAPPSRRRGRDEAGGTAGEHTGTPDSKGKACQRASRARKESACCTPALRRAAQAALDNARASLGSVDSEVKEHAIVVLHAHFKPVAASSFPTGRPPKFLPSAWHIDGGCVSEPVPRAFRAATSATQQRATAELSPETQARACTTESARHASCIQATHIGDVWCTGTTFCGIKLFWVSATARGRGVAYAIVEVARHYLCYGYEVPRDHVAFSEPTSPGSHFARRYQERDDFLVYY